MMPLIHPLETKLAAAKGFSFNQGHMPQAVGLDNIPHILGFALDLDLDFDNGGADQNLIGDNVAKILTSMRVKLGDNTFLLNTADGKFFSLMNMLSRYGDPLVTAAGGAGQTFKPHLPALPLTFFFDGTEYNLPADEVVEWAMTWDTTLSTNTCNLFTVHPLVIYENRPMREPSSKRRWFDQSKSAGEALNFAGGGGIHFAAIVNTPGAAACLYDSGILVTARNGVENVDNRYILRKYMQDAYRQVADTGDDADELDNMIAIIKYKMGIRSGEGLKGPGSFKTNDADPAPTYFILKED